MGEGRVVSFATVVTPRGSLRTTAVMTAPERTDRPRSEMTPEQVQALLDNATERGTEGGYLLAKILAMPPEERLQVLQKAVNEDPLVLWFALLPTNARQQIVNAAFEVLK